jgi:hypothetical protein
MGKFISWLLQGLVNMTCSFGAVLEEFEVRDALMTVLAGKHSRGTTPAAL